MPQIAPHYEGTQMKAYAYLRVSGRGQIEGDGFDRQLLACEQYAAANSVEIVRVFREEGVTGEALDRPALSDLFDALADTDVKTIIVERLDRFARDLMVQESLIRDLQRQGYQLISSAEPDLCSTDPSRIFVRQVFGALAQYEKAMIVAKLRGARQRKKAKAGRCEGKKPFGHYPKEAQALGQLREWAATGATPEHVAKDLNALGFQTRSGKPWHASTIRKILKREAQA